MSPDVVARESAAWLWYPDDATVVDTDDYLLIRWPAYFAASPSLMRLTPRGDVGATLDTAIAQAREWGLAELVAWIKLDAPAGFEDLLVARGGVPDETLDVFALDLAGGLPDLGVPALDVRWRDADNSRDFVEVGVAAFGEGTVPDEETLRRLGNEAHRDFLDGRGGQVTAYADGRALGAGGPTMAGTTARLWGGGVIPEGRGRGAYRAVLDARLRYAVDHGATMALVKGRVETSGPILRRAGFAAYGQERSYRLSLQ